MASTGVADVIVPAGSFASSTLDKRAASELYSGPKSKKVPIHDSMAGYDGSVPKQSDNIISRAKRRGYVVAS